MFMTLTAADSQMGIGVNFANSEEDQPRVLKCVLVGDAAVGKTSLIVSYTTNSWNKRYVPTAFDNYSVLVQVDHKPIRLELSDTAGQSEFDSLRPFSYPDSDVFLLCFNVMRPASLRSVTDHWLPEISKSSPNTPVILVGTHGDLRTNMDELMQLARAGERPVPESKGRMLAEELQGDYIECSALTQHNLKEVFDRAIIVALGGKMQKSVRSARASEKKTSSFTEGFRRLISMTKKFL